MIFHCFENRHEQLTGSVSGIAMAVEAADLRKPTATPDGDPDTDSELFVCLGASRAWGTVPKVRTSDGSEQVGPGFSPDRFRIRQHPGVSPNILSQVFRVRAEARTHVFSEGIE